MSADTEAVELRVDFDGFVCSDEMPYRERTRADGAPWRRPDGWHDTELVAVVVEALCEGVLNVAVPFGLLDDDGYVTSSPAEARGFRLEFSVKATGGDTHVDGDPSGYRLATTGPELA